MKKIIFILSILISCNCYSQTDKIFYEQKAFDFYRFEILDSFPVSKKIKVYQSVFDSHHHPFIVGFVTPDCLDNISWKNNNQFSELKSYTVNQGNLNPEITKLNFQDLDKIQFKIKKFGRGNYPKLFISSPHIENENYDRVFVNVYENHSTAKDVIYHLEFNKKGQIINWCRTVSEVIIIGH